MTPVIVHYKKETLATLVDQHGLTVVVTERGPGVRGTNKQWYASLQNVEIKDGGMLASCSANGATPEAATLALAKHICCKTLVVSAYGKDRKEIYVSELEELYQ